MNEPMLDQHGHTIECMHKDCWRRAVRIVSYESPNHKQFKGQSHDCCAVHSRPSQAELDAARTTEKTHTHAVDLLYCAEAGCEKSIKNHAWGRIKADGWFQQKDNTVWCPEHVPAWVEAWRAKQRKS